MKPYGQRHKLRSAAPGHQDCGICHPPLKPTHKKTARQQGKAVVAAESKEESAAMGEVEATTYPPEPPGHIGGAALALLELAKDPVERAKLTYVSDADLFPEAEDPDYDTTDAADDEARALDDYDDRDYREGRD